MTSVDEPLPVYLVKGGDEQLVEEGFLKLLTDLVGDEDRSLVIEDLTDATNDRDEIDVGAIVDACRTPPFLTSRRVIVFRKAWRLGPPEAEAIVAYLEDPSPTAVLVLEGTSHQRSQLPTRVTKAVQAVGHVIDTTAGTGKTRDTWLKTRLKESGLRFEAAAVDALSKHLGEDTGRLPGLLVTLAGAFGEGAKVGLSDLEPFLGAAGGVAPWDLTDAIDRRDTAGALEQLHRMMRGGGRHPLEIMGTLHRHFQAMLRLDGSDATDKQAAAALLGINPYPADKALRQARALGPANIFRAIELLATADMALRGEGWPSGNDELVMEILVARLSKLAPATSTARRR